MTGRRMRNNHNRGMFGKVGLFLYVGISLFAIIWLRAAVVNLEYEIGDLDRLRADLLNERKMVVAQRSRFLSMGNVETVAIRKLGMSNAERDKIFFVRRATAAVSHRASLK